MPEVEVGNVDRKEFGTRMNIQKQEENELVEIMMVFVIETIMVRLTVLHLMIPCMGTGAPPDVIAHCPKP